jgi:hypothetical protein
MKEYIKPTIEIVKMDNTESIMSPSNGNINTYKIKNNTAINTVDF